MDNIIIDSFLGTFCEHITHYNYGNSCLMIMLYNDITVTMVTSITNYYIIIII